ncbi:MAG: hypothetical protein HYX76_01955 [Acidobacteria bacterium]|nr:hypothetical protein [Acidobacteriota bacterium]
MWTRRAFRRHAGTAGAAALAILKPDGIARAAAVPSRVADRSLDSVARDETYWGQIQQAFTLDRTIINLSAIGSSSRPSRTRSTKAFA